MEQIQNENNPAMTKAPPQKKTLKIITQKEPKLPPTDPSVPVEEKQKQKRCPRGTRKNKKGDCVPVNNKEPPIVQPPINIDASLQSKEKELINKSIEEELERQLTKQVIPKHIKRCPKGTRRDKKGECVSSEIPNMAPEVSEQPEPSVPPIVLSEIQTEIPIIIQNKKTELTTQPLPPPPQEPQKEMKTQNSYLKQKEYLEYVRNKENYQKKTEKYTFLYPELNDPYFNVKIASRKEFNDTQYDGAIYNIENRANEMCSAKFELNPHQMFVKNFLSFQTPYNSLLLYHSLGTGKTCSAIGICEEMRTFMKQVGIKEKIMIVASPNLQGNFRKQLFDDNALQQIVNPNSPDEMVWNMETCVGNSLLNEVNPNENKSLTREKVVSNINSIINTYYEFMGYGQLANFISSVLKIDNVSGYNEKEIRAMEIKAIRKTFNNRLIVIDEVHNIRLGEENKSSSQVASLLMKVAKYAEGMRLLLLSATPMFNSYEEIVWLINLMSLNDKRSIIDIRDIFQVDGEFKKPTKNNEEGGRELLVRKLTGYVSYVRGENPYSFPFRVYPKHFEPHHTFEQIKYPSIQMNGKPIEQPLKHVNVYLNSMPPSTFQQKTYSFLMENMRKRNYDVYSKNTGELIREMPSFENMDTFGYTVLQMPLETLNMVYPSPPFEKTLEEYKNKKNVAMANQHKELIHICVGEKGLNNVFTYDTLTKPNMIKCHFDYKPEIVEKYGRIFAPENLPQYSIKISNICKEIQKSTGIVIIYSQFIDGGVIPMALALEEMGFTRFGSAQYTKPLFKTPPTPPIDAITMKPTTFMNSNTNADPNASFKPAKYVIISGDKYYSPDNKKEMKYITSSNNTNGEIVKVVLITRSGSEGLDFKNIRQIHIMEPWYNMNRIEQIIGRGVRNLSHCKLPFSQRNVQIYMHGTVFENSEEEAADVYVYRVAEKKALQIGKITRILKENAVDCLLNIEQTHFTPELLGKIEENKQIQLELSNGQKIQYRVGDQPYTDICDYMDNCEFTCNTNGREVETSLEDTNYNTQFAQTNSIYIGNRIKQLYLEFTTYHIDQLIKSINIKKNYPLEQIYYVLTEFIKNKYTIIDKYGRYGRLINKDNYYLFQPVEIGDEQITVLERSIPLNYNREKLTLEVPTQIAPLENPPPYMDKKETEPTKPDATETEKETDPTKIDEGVVATYRKLVEIITENIKNTTNPSNTKKTTDWYKHFYNIKTHLTAVYRMSEIQMDTHILNHCLDMLMYEERINIIKYLFGERDEPFHISPKLESEIKAYFQNKIMKNAGQNKMGILVPNGEAFELWIRSIDESDPEWRKGENYDYNLFVADFGKYNIPTNLMNEIIGFTIDFKKKEMVFKVKDLRQKRNNNGARIDSAGKSDIIKLLNSVVGEERYTNENTDKEFNKIGLCIVLELIMRQYTEERMRGRVYYLNPEQALVRNISKM